ITAHQLPQCDGNARPALAGGTEGGERNLVVFDARDVLHDTFAVRCPSIDAEGEVSSRRGHLCPLLPQSFSACASARACLGSCNHRSRGKEMRNSSGTHRSMSSPPLLKIPSLKSFEKILV